MRRKRRGGDHFQYSRKCCTRSVPEVGSLDFIISLCGSSQKAIYDAARFPLPYAAEFLEPE